VAPSVGRQPRPTVTCLQFIAQVKISQVCRSRMRLTLVAAGGMFNSIFSLWFSPSYEWNIFVFKGTADGKD